jgi:ribosomal protein L37E
MMQTSAEMWLAKNAIDCGRYAARMSPKSCEDFRAASPQKCLGCVRMTEEVTAEDLAQAKKGRFVNRSSYSRSPRAAATEKKGSKSMAKKQVRPVAVCVGCGHERPIMGKQKCGSCYGKARRAEKMAAKAPVQPLVQPPKAFAFGGPTAPMSDEERMAVADMAPAVAPASTFVADLDCVLFELRSMLLAKNAAYGDSALNPVRVFSQADPVEQLRVRIDDKISRLMRGAACGEDTVGDLMGYLVLLKIAEGRA